MIPFTVRVKRHNTIGLALRQWNKVVSNAMQAAGRHWVTKFLPLHFQPGAQQRYRLQSRALGYRKRKQDAIRVKSSVSGEMVPATKPPAPLVFAGDLKRRMEQGVNSFNIRATATQKRARCMIALPLTHPMRKEYAPEVKKLTAGEFSEMRRIAGESIRDQIKVMKVQETFTIT